jgi:RNA polymerase sigma-70 factor (ECF subfamily)
VFERYGGVMTTLAASMLRDRVEADDVVEETLVRIHRAGPGFRGSRGLRTWTLRIVANLCRDRLRRRKFTVELPDEPDALANARLAWNPGSDWDRAIDGPKLAAALEQALAALPVDQREAVVMKYRLEMSQAEISEALGIPEGTVKSRIGRGLEALRRALKEWKT